MALQASYEQVHGQEIQSDEQQQQQNEGSNPGTHGHPQGKLRVINQGMMNATENIQTSEETSNPSAATTNICQAQSGSEGQFIGLAASVANDVCDPNPLDNVIETPISSKQLSWLTQPKPPPRSEENSTEVPAQATEGGEDVTVSGGFWNLPPSTTEEEDDASKKPAAAAVAAATAEASSSSTNPSFPNWHLLTNVQQHQQQLQQQREGQDFLGCSTASSSSGSILKHPGSGDNMLAIRCVS